MQQFNHIDREMGRVARPDMEPFSIKRLDDSCQTMTFPTPTIRSVANCFVYLRQGELLIESHEKSITVSANELLIIPQGVPFSIRYYSDCVGVMGGFHSSFIGSGVFCQTEIRQVKMLQEKHPMKCSFMGKRGELMASLFEHIYEEFQGGNYNSDLIKCWLMSILAETNAMIQPCQSLFTENLCDLFLQRLFDEGKDILTIPEYADELKVTANHLNRVVKQETGKPLSRWMDDCLLIRAKALLCETDWSISEIAASLKILDSSYFARKFKKHTTLTPVEYRKKYGMKGV